MTLEDRIQAYFRSQGFVAESVEEADQLLLECFNLPGEYLLELYTARTQQGDDFPLDDGDLETIAAAWPLLFWQFPRIDTPVYAILYGIIARLADELRRPLRILDAGCGVGLSLGFLAAEFPQHQFVAYDIETIWVEAARRRIEGLRVANITLQVGGHEEISFSAEPFDLILCMRSGGADAPCCPRCETDHWGDFAWSLAHYEVNLEHLRIGGEMIEVRGLNHYGLDYLAMNYADRFGLKVTEHHLLEEIPYDEMTCHDGDPISIGVVLYRYDGRPAKSPDIGRSRGGLYVAG